MWKVVGDCMGGRVQVPVYRRPSRRTTACPLPTVLATGEPPALLSSPGSLVVISTCCHTTVAAHRVDGTARCVRVGPSDGWLGVDGR